MDRTGESAVGAGAAADAALPGQAIYTRPVLAIYDVWVHGIFNPLIWRCRTRHLRRLYARHLTANHMDVGIGTGYFLSRCAFPVPAPRLLLVDANSTCLAVAARRLRRYRPGLHRGNILEPLDDVGAPFDSIGLMYVLHCLPGDLAEKAAVFDNLNACLAAGGVVFGATILGRGVDSSPVARRLMAAYGARGIFSNANDHPDALGAVLAARYEEVEIEIKGSVALFSARRPLAAGTRSDGQRDRLSATTGSDLRTSASGRSSGC
jgi:SAM-dependent methyltransferase